MNLTELAKQAVKTFIENGGIISPLSDLPKEFFQRKSGTFVTIEKRGELRGCIGTYLPTRENIAEEIIHNAIAAATEDWRFGPIQPAELAHLSYTVYILSEPELVKDIKDPTKSSEEEFRRAGLDPKKFGIIVKSATGYKSALLLPGLEGVDTVEQQLWITCQKGEINPKEEKIIIYRFTVEKYTE